MIFKNFTIRRKLSTIQRNLKKLYTITEQNNDVSDVKTKSNYIGAALLIMRF